MASLTYRTSAPVGAHRGVLVPWLHHDLVQVDVRGPAGHEADDLRHVRDTVLTIIAEQTGQTCERIFDDSLRAHVFTATESVEYGFVDHIVTDIAQIRPRSAAAAGFEVSNA